MAGCWIMITTGFSVLFWFQKKHTRFYFTYVCIHAHGRVCVCVSAYYKHMYNVSLLEKQIPAEIITSWRVENLSP